MKKVNNFLNYDYLVNPGEVNDQASETVPDQTMSVREIMDRYARGLPVGGQRTPVFDEDDEMPDPKTMDLVDRQRQKMEFEQELQDINARKQRRERNKARKEPLAPRVADEDDSASNEDENASGGQ